MLVAAELVDPIDPFPQHFERGATAAFVVLVAFLVTFLAVRTSTRLARAVSWLPSGVEAGGVHVHHLVLGIVLMLLCGFLAFAAPLEAPWWHLIAAGFGVGAGLTVDEFALWVHLRDVYWSEEGRASFDAVVCTIAFASLVVLGVRPFGLDGAGPIWGTIAAVSLVVGLSLICFLKERIFLGIVGLFVPFVALVGAVRLGKPHSPWARWRYDEAKRARAAERFAATRPLERAGRRISDLVAGAPSRKDEG